MPVFAQHKPRAVAHRRMNNGGTSPRIVQHSYRHAHTLALALACAALLAGCAGSKTNSAMELIQHQQEQQALLRQHEADTMQKNAPSEPKVMLAMIRESQQQQRYFASLAYIDAYAREYGDSTELAALRANALRMTGQAAQAQAAYQALLDTNEAATGWHGLGLLAAASGNYVQAATDLGKAAALRPTDAEYLNDLGFARVQSGDLAGARLPLGQAAELAPANGKILANLALLLLLQGDAGQAQTVMDKAQLPQTVRDQVYRLAGEWRMSSHAAAGAQTAAAYGGHAASASPVDTAYGGTPAMPPSSARDQTASRPIVTAANDETRGNASINSPVGFHQTPLTGGFGHAPLIR